MNKVRYNLLTVSQKKAFVDEYELIFDDALKDNVDKNGDPVKGMENRWQDWKAKNDTSGKLTETVRELLTADFDKLVDVFVRFRDLNIPIKNPSNKKERNPVLKDLDGIFAYANKFDSKIADHFVKYAERLKITTCHYCEMAFINTYSYVNDKNLKETRRQFDIDHFLPKDECPCVGLSLFNFVPSCQVCNSRIKGDNLPSEDKNDLLKLSPTSVHADFDNNIAIRLRMIPLDDSALGKRYIYFRTHKPYEKFVNFFHLEERYEFHKSEALRLKKLKERYPDSNIKAIARLLKRREATVREDIFQEGFLKREGRCFQRMTMDILTNRKI